MGLQSRVHWDQPVCVCWLKWTLVKAQQSSWCVRNPLLSHSYRNGLGMSLAHGIWEDGVDFKQSWHPAFLSYVYSPTFYLSPPKVKSGWFTCFSVFSFSKSLCSNEYMYLHTCSNVRKLFLIFMLFSPCLSQDIFIHPTEQVVGANHEPFLFHAFPRLLQASPKLSSG